MAIVRNKATIDKLRKLAPNLFSRKTDEQLDDMIETALLTDGMSLAEKDMIRLAMEGQGGKESN